MGNGFESKPIESFQNGFTADYKGENGGVVNELSLNPVGGDDDFDDMFGDFETEFKEQPLKKRVNMILFDLILLISTKRFVHFLKVCIRMLSFSAY